MRTVHNILHRPSRGRDKGYVRSMEALGCGFHLAEQVSTEGLVEPPTDDHAMMVLMVGHWRSAVQDGLLCATDGLTEDKHQSLQRERKQRMYVSMYQYVNCNS